MNDEPCLPDTAAPPARHPSLAAHAARVRELQPGLRMHADDAIDAFDTLAQGDCAPGLHLVLLLEGGLDLSYGDRRIVLSTAPATPPGVRARAARTGGQARSVIVNVSRPERFTRRMRQGRYARRLSLCVSHEWMDRLQAGHAGAEPLALRGLLADHLSLHSWQPSARAVALAEQILRPPEAAPMLQRLYQDSRVLDLLAEALDPLHGGAPQPEAPAAGCAVARRLRDLREFLNSPAADGLSLQEIAREVGMNPNALQSHFRRSYGTTVIAFMRESRLQRARLALERDGVSIKRAAALAGYTSAANFATAFGRLFGITPTQARRAMQR